jgi:hypothetical protein
MDFFSDFASDRNGHHYDLLVFASRHLPAKGRVLTSGADDIELGFELDAHVEYLPSSWWAHGRSRIRATSHDATGRQAPSDGVVSHAMLGSIGGES